jgi:hypothetical protein
MMEHTSRGPRLQTLRRVLEYALAESEELGLAHMDKLLGRRSPGGLRRTRQTPAVRKAP